MSLNVTVKPDWPSGLCLLGRTFAVVNKDKQVLNTNIKQPVTVKVPSRTKAVHVAVVNADVCFGPSTSPASDRVKSMWFEVSEFDDSKLANNQFKFEFKALLEGGAPNGSFTGYFVLDIMCFGEPE